MTNEQLVSLIQTGNKDHIGELYSQMEKLIRKIAMKYCGYAEMDDLMQEGFLGLMDAVKVWDPERSNSFANFSTYYIRIKMLLYIENNGHALRISSSRHTMIRKYNRVVNAFILSHAREPSAKEIAAMLRITPDQVTDIQADIKALNTESLNAPLSMDDELTVADTIPDPHNSIDDLIDEIENGNLSAELWSIVNTLPDQEKRVILAKYRDGVTVKETARRLNMTDNRVRCAEKRALKEMRRAHNLNRLKKYNDFYEVAAYQCTGLSYFRQTGTSSPERAVMLLDGKRPKG